jgi:ferric-dicitrate binding protein FerR (iron transport regulator)
MNLEEKIGRYLINEASDFDKKSIDKWGSEKPENKQALENLENIWGADVIKSNHIPSDSFIERLNYRMRQDLSVIKRPNITIFWKIAAAILLLIAIGTSIGWLSKTDSYSGELMVMTANGQKSQTILPDGTHVWLHSNTKLSYNLSEWSSKRIVKCDGEAYFEVTHDESYPFIVDGGDTHVKVLGTKFNVRNYEGEGLFSATLTEGKVEIIGTNSNTSRVLEPGEQYILNRNNESYRVQEVDVAIVKEWKEGILVLESVSFPELTYRLERFYGVKFVYDANHFAEFHYSGTFDNLSLSQVLNILKMTMPFNFEINNGIVKLEKIN